MWAAYGLLNAAVCALVLGVRPLRAANYAVALMVGANAAFAFASLARDAFGLFLDTNAATNLADTASLAGLLLIPWLFPRRRLGRRGERALYAVVGAYLAMGVAAAAMWLPLVLALPFGLLPMAGIVAGVLLSLDTYLRGPSRALQVQARFVLAAYALKAMSLTYILTIVNQQPGPHLVWAALAAVLLAVPLAFLATRLGLLHAPLPRALREDAFVVGVASLGFLIWALGGDSYPEFLLVRPLLLAYGMLHYQMLDVDLRRQWWAAATAVLGAVGVLYAVALGILEGLGAPTGLASGFALVLALGAGLAAGLPLGRRYLAPEREPHGPELYRAALEAAAAEPGHSSSNEALLGVLRQRLGISEREAALAAHEARAAAGRGGKELAAGAMFLGRYEVERLLGQGGSARTFLARDMAIGRRVVLKVARAEGREEAARLQREARILARLHHPAIVTVFDVEQVAGEVVLVLEHMPGGSLADRLREGPLPVAEAVRMADRLLQALEAAHREGVVHRDVKPGNVLRTAEGEAKLADFGVARALDTGTVSGFTATGATPGTLRYMSPEQVRGEAADARSDLYAVGAVLYEALSGKHYLDLDRRPGLDALAGILDDAPRLPLPGVPRELDRLLADLLAKDRAARPASAAEARQRLARVPLAARRRAVRAGE